MGFLVLSSYFQERTNRTYYGFLNYVREEIISSNYAEVNVDHWRRNDDNWFGQFIKAAEQNVDKSSFESLKEM
ncbi:4892_t:CDS:1, partial [Gigaspora rosea]